MRLILIAVCLGGRRRGRRGRAAHGRAQRAAAALGPRALVVELGSRGRLAAALVVAGTSTARLVTASAGAARDMRDAAAAATATAAAEQTDARRQRGRDKPEDDDQRGQSDCELAEQRQPAEAKAAAAGRVTACCPQSRARFLTRFLGWGPQRFGGRMRLELFDQND